MSDPMSDQVARLLRAARELPTPERAAWVRKQGAAADVERQVLAGLDDLPTADPSADARNLQETIDVRSTAKPEGASPTDIGPYHILQSLGEGGMGTVYLAEQRHPVRRRVALKVLKKGMDSKAFLTRFDAERQALAMMEHSCIAKVLDAGVSGTGQPYLAMEYVKGVPITEYCDDNKVSLAERVRLFRDVCSGVQHAHTKGVMHRDLKPSNVLVTLQDGKPTPKIIDFGLAKAVDHRLVEGTLFTEAGQVIGTPEYMSPEQAGVGGLDVDTRTDVYSLGVLLYQLLTGSLPVTREELLRNGWLEMQRMIREDEPKKPSTRVTTLGPAAEAHAKVRGLPAGDFSKRLRGDLDWIVMKALEKDRSRRYETAQELAADLLRHLNDEPVTAGPPTAGYLLSKMFRRYRAQVMTGVLMVSALAAGLVVALVQWREAEHQKDLANEQRAAAETARSDAELQRLAAEEQKRIAGENLENFGRLRDDVKLRTFQKRASEFVENAASLRGRIAWRDEVESWLAAMSPHEANLATLRKDGRERPDGSFDFSDPSQQFLHDALARLVDDLARFRSPTGELARMTESIAWCESVQKLTIDDRADDWAKVATTLRTHPDFRIPAFPAQEGLIPLGADPRSGLQEFLFARSGEAPVRGSDGRWVITERTGIVFVLLPGKQTTIGSDAADAPDVEKPTQSVSLAPFFLAKHELTQAQWLRLAGIANPSRFRPPPKPEKGHPKLTNPVESVTWLEATALATRYGLQLPTEAQWEYASRAGTTTRWYFGDQKEDLVKDGKCLFNAADGLLSRGDGQFVEDSEFWPELDDGFVVTAPVGSFPPNAFGLLDMHGNVAEMTRDDFAPYSAVATTPSLQFADGTGLLTGGNPNRITHRGGSWFKRVEAARSSARKAIAKDARYDNIGVRLARAVQ